MIGFDWIFLSIGASQFVGTVKTNKNISVENQEAYAFVGAPALAGVAA